MKLRLGLQVAAALLWAASASATTITLSTNSSDATPAADLDATLDFSVSGTTLTLTATNTGTLFDINQIFFNGTGAVTSVSLTGPGGWSLTTGQTADGFGVFGYKLAGGEIADSGGVVVFTFTVNAGLSDADFTTAFSTIPPGDTPAIAAAKFVHGPDDPESPGNEDSAYGAYVPEPATALFLGLGLLGLAAVKRRPAA